MSRQWRSYLLESSKTFNIYQLNPRRPTDPLPAGGREHPRGKTKLPAFANPAIVCYVKRWIRLNRRCSERKVSSTSDYSTV